MNEYYGVYLLSLDLDRDRRYQQKFCVRHVYNVLKVFSQPEYRKCISFGVYNKWRKKVFEPIGVDLN